MKRFPFVIFRLAGLPVRWVEAIAPSSPSITDQNLQLQQELQTSRLQLNDDLQHLIAALKNYQLKKYLSNVRSDLFNQRNFKLGPLQSLHLDAEEKAIIQRVIEQLHTFKELENEVVEQRVLFENWWAAQIKSATLHLQKFSKHPVLQKGLPLSSLSVTERVLAFAQKPIDQHRKKERQTAYSLLQYLSRIVLKISPFSHFTPLGLKEVDEAKYYGKTRINNHLLAYLQECLTQYPPFYRRLSIRCNPSLREEEGEWIFLLNARNLESIQRLAADELLDFIREQVAAKNEGVIIEDLVQELVTAVDAAEEDIANYLLQLLNIGFLEWHWAISGLDPNWMDQLLPKLAPFQEDHLLNALYRVLGQIRKELNHFSEADLPQRRHLMTTYWSQIQTLTTQFSTQQAQSATAIENKEEAVFQRFSGGQFPFGKERLFYEDVYQAVSLQVPEEELMDFQQTQQRFINALLPLNRHPIRDDLWAFLVKQFPSGGQIALTKVYEHFYRNRIPQRNWQLAIIEQAKALIQDLKLSEKGDLYLDQNLLDQLASLTASDAPKGIAPTANSYGGVWQLYHEEGKWRTYVDASILGYGKLSARFLHLFPQEVYQQQYAWNKALSKEDDNLWVENTDGSYFNANLHPQLCDWELWSPGSQNRLATTYQIPITDLAIQYQAEEDQLSLIRVSTNQSLKVMDLGLEALQGRSPMYQLLSAFGPLSPSHHPLLALINNVFRQRSPQGVLIHPRIRLSENMMIQRRAWYYPKALIPQPKAGETKTNYYLRFHQWRREQHLPAEVFIRLHPSDLQIEGLEPQVLKSLKADDYKPQYLNWESPIYLSLWLRLLKRIPVLLKIEEMWPSTRQLPLINGEKRAVEAVVQWRVNS
ncbi:MAG: lantibiotic dehydratase [Bacteroidota bacterium]